MNHKQIAWVITIILGIVALFQLALILGVPWGKAAWGGQHAVLPMAYRIGSVTTLLLYVLIIFLTWKRVILPQKRIYQVTAWLFCALFLVGTIMNTLTTSPVERIWAPVNLLLVVAFFPIAKGSKTKSS